MYAMGELHNGSESFQDLTLVIKTEFARRESKDQEIVILSRVLSDRLNQGLLFVLLLAFLTATKDMTQFATGSWKR